jgi:hypothetical protein
MRFLPVFLLRIVKAASRSDERQGVTYITIRRPYAHLEDELRRAFERQKDIKVVVDRRYAERRTRQRPIPLERRRADRRRPKEELVEAVMSV